MSPIQPIRRAVLVDADPDTAFEIFTERIGSWWPLADKGVFGEGSTVAFTNGRLVEQASDGTQDVWGTVTRWEPGAAIAFTWHPGLPVEESTQVEVTFVAADSQTLVSVEHSGWEHRADPSAARAQYEQGWPTVIDCYRKAVAPALARTDATWIALVHRPGPAAPTYGSVFEEPLFAEHLAFLGRMRDAGYLVAAGPLGDSQGEGMTVLRLPGAGGLEQAHKLATENDVSVASGLFTVTVRHWQVGLTG
jgi:uncharacterized protein YciI